MSPLMRKSLAATRQTMNTWPPAWPQPGTGRGDGGDHSTSLKMPATPVLLKKWLTVPISTSVMASPSSFENGTLGRYYNAIDLGAESPSAGAFDRRTSGNPYPEVRFSPSRAVGGWTSQPARSRTAGAISSASEAKTAAVPSVSPRIRV